MSAEEEDKRDFLEQYALVCARFGYVIPDCVDHGVAIWEKIGEVIKADREAKAAEGDKG